MDLERDIPPQVVISVRDEEKEEETSSANPQSFSYFVVLFLAVLLLMVPLGFAPNDKKNESLFKAHHDPLMVMINALLSVATLSSVILIFSSFFLQRWMKNLHYTILKTIGCFSAIPVPVLLAVVIFVPHNLNLIVYIVICEIINVVILVAYYFAWIYACRYQQDTRCNEYPVHWTAFLLILVPSIFVIPYYIPTRPLDPYLCVCGVILFVVVYVRIVVPMIKTTIQVMYGGDDAEQHQTN
ncbi:hypothetical protein Tco_1455742 [Tanacetum coccineum]